VSDVEVFKFIPCQIKVGIEKDKSGVYPDKNRISRVLPLEDTKANKTAEPKAAASASAKPEVKAAAKPTPQPAAADATKANGPIPPWRQQKPTLAEDLNDEIPHSR